MKTLALRSLRLYRENQLIRFLAVGGVNTVFGYSCFALFTFMGLHYSLAVLLSTVLGVLFNFKTTGVLVFGNKDNRLIFRFVLVYAVVYGVNVLSLWLLKSAGLNSYAAQAIVVLPLAMLSFVLNKFLVFT